MGFASREHAHMLERDADVATVVKERLVGAPGGRVERQHRFGRHDAAAWIHHAEQRRDESGGGDAAAAQGQGAAQQPILVRNQSGKLGDKSPR